MPDAKPRVMLVGGTDVDARLALMHHLAEDFEVAALGAAPELAARFRAEGFAYESYPLGEGRVTPLSDLRALRGLTRAFRRHRPHVVHAFDSKPSVWGCLAARMVGVPVAIGTVNGLGFLYGGEGTRARLVWGAYKRLQALAARASQATVFQNRDDAEHFIAERIVPADKARIILGSGVSTQRFTPERIAARDRERVRCDLGLRPQDVVVTMISRIIRSKGVLEFAQAARSIRAERSNVRFVLIGPLDRESMDRLGEAEVRELEASLIWPGARRDVPAVLAVSDVVALPTAYREGLPRVLLEAGAMGLPLVTTDAPGCREVVEDGVNGFLMPVGDAPALATALRRLIEDPELRRRLGRRSRERVVRRFDLAAIAAETRNLYHLELRRRLASPEPVALA